jgi:hypothetical protein
MKQSKRALMSDGVVEERLNLGFDTCVAGHEGGRDEPVKPVRPALVEVRVRRAPARPGPVRDAAQGEHQKPAKMI